MSIAVLAGLSVLPIAVVLGLLVVAHGGNFGLRPGLAHA